MIEEIYHNECDCLFAENILDHNCRKRYFQVLDLDNNKMVRIFICNEHLRLLIYKNNIDSKKHDEYYYESHHIVSSIIINIISKYVNLYDVSNSRWGYGNGNLGLLKRKVNIKICDKPYIYASISTVDCVNLALKYKRSYVVEDLHQHIMQYVEYTKGCKYNQLKILNNKIKKTWDLEEKNILINELFIELLKIK